MARRSRAAAQLPALPLPAPPPASAHTPAGAPGAAVPARPAARPRPRVRTHWLRNTLLFLIAFILLGLAPMALAARVFDLGPLSRLPLVPYVLPAPPGALASTPPPNLALPLTAWVANETAVLGAPGSGGRPLATLEPGFPVILTGHTTISGALWDAVSWTGPTSSTGGRGWMPDTALTQAGADGPTVADIAALSPSVATVLAQLGPTAALAVYYPAARQLYLANADRSYPLGDGARALVLAALLAAPGAPTGSAVTQRLAQADAATLAVAYHQIGGSAGLTTFLGNAGITGITPGPSTWSDTQATPRALAQFYAALAGLTPGADLGLAPAAHAQALTALAPDSSVLSLAGLGDPLPSGASVTLVTGASQQAAAWTVCAGGFLTAPSGLSYVATLCAPNQSSRAAGLSALAPVFAALAALASD